ncbi:hypothetical protein QBB33_07410 [Streptomyces scabiei]|uniref:hypothetical protein n=1 Tax=Streptomyces scabiei TaxID=1930 RepID=UPI0005A1F5DA|nr:hypothetical protein [Streptomyces scabiei]MDX3033132.1 hypothetical protein [Streptomyces scabiei]MDX3212464.1 hypothetical protein [Streptomyces scabiei]
MQSQVARREGELPLRFRRPFQLWSYQVSHRRLVLRSHPGGGLDGTVEIEFLNVLGMKLKSHYSELLVSAAPDAATTRIDEFVDIPDRHKAKFNALLVSDGSDDGFVVCGSLRVREA